MHVLIAIACAVVVVVLAMSGVPRRVGVRRALVGTVTFFAVGAVWVLAVWIITPRLLPVFDALPGAYARAILAMLLLYAPPVLSALATVRLVPRAPR